MEQARTRPAGVPLLLLLLSAVALHGTALRKPFFADDYFFLEQARGQSLPAVLTSPDPLGNFLRPVGRQLYFWILSRLGGETPTVFHVANLALFLASLVLVYLIARRRGGTLAAFLATAFLAFHYAADVPLRWVSGSQDLLAIMFSAAAVYLFCRGNRIPAALSLLFGLLSKESVALAAGVAIVAARQPSERWQESLRRGWPLLAVTTVWGIWWAFTLHQRPATGQTLSFAPGDLLAAFVHLVQVALGLEFRLGGSAMGHWTILAIVVGGVAAGLVWLLGRIDPEPKAPPSSSKLDLRSPMLQLGVAWSLAGTLPLLLVMPIWSAYYYLFAMVGVAMIVGALASQLQPTARIALMGILVMLSANARALDEFATTRGAWTWQSHVDRHYLDRAQSTIERYLRQMKAARPTLPPRSTVFFANLPVSLGWQAGNGPLVRWAYGDSSLRSYFLTQFSKERTGRGPLFFFAVENDSLTDKSASPLILPSFAYSMILAERPQSAVEALDLALRTRRQDRELQYWRALAHWGAGDTLLALEDFRAAGMQPARGLPPGTSQTIGAVTDTAARIGELLRLRERSALNPWIHARLAALLLAIPERQKQGVIEAYAFKTLAPEDPDSWRKWSSAQLSEKQFEPALNSLERYLALSDRLGTQDGEARRVVHALRRLVRGDVAQAALQAH